jgi:hypothetical protein
LIEKIVDGIEKRKYQRDFLEIRKCAEVYQEIKALPQSEREKALHNRVARKRYEHAVRLWGELD